MADTTPTTPGTTGSNANQNTTSNSFLNGVTEGLMSAIGTVGAAYVTANAQKGTATPGANSGGVPAAATGNPAAITTSNAVKYALIAAVAAVLLIVGIKLIKK